MIKKIRYIFFRLRAILFAKIELKRIMKLTFKSKIQHKEALNSIVHINSDDYSGGAAKIARDLIYYQNSAGLNSKLLVAKKNTNNDNFKEIELLNSRKQHFLNYASKELEWLDFFHLSTFELINNKEVQNSDIIHLHNVHGNYFSFLALPEISNAKNVVWSLHDMQSFTGHCAYSLNCTKWQSGCGNCPDLTIYPAIKKDTTAFVWKIKNEIYKKSNIHIVVLSEWLEKLVKKSNLGHFKIHKIYNGIDISIYKQYDKTELRKSLGLPLDKVIVLFSANLGLNNPFKGGKYAKMLIDKYISEKILFINIGGNDELSNSSNVKNISYISDESLMAKYYSLSDIYLYPTIADNCPLVALEAMACGLPILTFNTGGVPELVVHKENGYIAEYEDFEDLKNGFDFLIKNDDIRLLMGKKSVDRVKEKFTIQKMNDSYIDLYKRILNNEFCD